MSPLFHRPSKPVYYIVDYRILEVLNRSARPVPIMEQLQTNSGLINELVNYDNILDKPYEEVLKR